MSTQQQVMSLGKSIELAHELSSRLKTLNPHAEQVVGIANGAALVAKVISDDLGLPLRMISVRRKSSIVKDKLAKIPGFLRLMSYCHGIPFISRPIYMIVDRLMTLSYTPSTNEESSVVQNIILVDDAIASGQSFHFTEKLLRDEGCENITSAVLTWSDSFDDSYSPDVYLGRKLLYYPWSGNSPFLKEYATWLKSHNLAEYV